jgi:recombination associated protein RdgC
VSPFGRESDVLTLALSRLLFGDCKTARAFTARFSGAGSLGRRTNRSHIEMREQRRVRGKEKKAVQEEVIRELIPQAFTRSQKSQAYVDTKNGWLILNTSNRKKAQDIIQLLRQTLGFFAGGRCHNLSKPPARC